MHNSKGFYSMKVDGSDWAIEIRPRKEHDGVKAWILQNGREAACLNGSKLKLKKHDLGFSLASIPEEVKAKAKEMQEFFANQNCCGSCEN